MHKSIRALQKVSQRHTQKFRNQRIRCTFHNNMRISKRQWFLNQQTARVDNVFLSITSSPIRDGHIETRTGRKEHRMVGSHKFKIRQCRPSSPKSCSSHDHEMSTFRLKKCQKSQTAERSKENHVLRRPQEHTHMTIREISMHQSRKFPQDTNHCCATADKSVDIVSDLRMNAQCNCPGSQRLAHQLTRPSHSR